MSLSEFIPCFAMAASLALILVLPLLSERPPELPAQQEKQVSTAPIYFSHIFW
jgi:hypothetical protein